MDFYCIYENDRGLNTASSPFGGGNGDRNGSGKEGSNGGGITDLSIYLGIGDVPTRSVWSRFLRYLGTTRETLSTLSFSYLLTIELPQCYNNLMNKDFLLIIDSGASVCISPHWLDFITYMTSKMKIKDLSSSNKVAGEGLLRWKVEDFAVQVVNLDLPPESSSLTFDIWRSHYSNHAKDRSIFGKWIDSKYTFVCTKLPSTFTFHSRD